MFGVGFSQFHFIKFGKKNSCHLTLYCSTDVSQALKNSIELAGITGTAHRSIVVDFYIKIFMKIEFNGNIYKQIREHFFCKKC